MSEPPVEMVQQHKQFKLQSDFTTFCSANVTEKYLLFVFNKASAPQSSDTINSECSSPIAVETGKCSANFPTAMNICDIQISTAKFVAIKFKCGCVRLMENGTSAEGRVVEIGETVVMWISLDCVLIIMWYKHMP